VLVIGVTESGRVDDFIPWPEDAERDEDGSGDAQRGDYGSDNGTGGNLFLSDTARSRSVPRIPGC
jgi:hypothetical protein